jgi:putative hydrolase of the HAD superfamily
MIGDSLEADIEGAMNIGMDVIYFNEFKKPIDLQIPNVFHLSEIKQYL